MTDLKNIINDLINGRTEQATVSVHEYLVSKVKELHAAPQGINEGKETPHFGLENDTNVKKTKAALKNASIEFTSAFQVGFTYFYFTTKRERNAANKIMLSVIDSSKEQE